MSCPTMECPADHKAGLQALAAQQREKFVQGDAIGVLLGERAHYVDNLLRKLWQQHRLTDQAVALVAVGGYGRGELHPGSDIDLLLLVAEDNNNGINEAVSGFVTALWDLKLEIGHSVRTPDQTLALASDDITIATNLLEARWLCGDESLFRLMQHKLTDPLFWPSSPFFEAKLTEQQQRHKKSNAFDLEPNLKSCPGGLRDIQTISWVAMRHFKASCLADLVSHKFLEPAELEELTTCRDYLWRLRFALHCVAGRAEDRLLFDHQKAVAELMGFRDGTQLAVEQMMKRYYRSVRAVQELNQMLLLLFRANLRSAPITDVEILDDDFQCQGRQIRARHPEVFQKPANLLRLFLDMARRPQLDTVSADTLRLMRRARRQQKAPLETLPECRELFMTILKHENGIKALSLMHRHGLLATYCAAWQHIVGQMQFDLFHAFTVDEHTCRLLDFIERFATPEHKTIFPLGSVLIDQLPKKGLLVLAALFHDIGKGRGGDHSEVGAEMALQFCHLHGLQEHDARLVAWLVANHLLMSVTAQRRDITDPKVIETFAGKVQDTDRLSYLYCLTVADICATNDSLWNNWKGSLLRELYHSTRDHLNNAQATPVDSRAKIREHKEKARQHLLRQGLDPEAIDALWQRLSADYFLRFSPAQIQWHSECLLPLDKDQYLVQLSRHVTRGGTELLVYGPDRPGLFALTVGLLDSKRIAVHDAQIFTTRDGYALDSFVILDHDGEAVEDPSRVRQLRRQLEQALTQGKLPNQRPRPLPRRLRSFNVATRVQFLPSQRHNTTTMELVSLDRPGLLAQIARVLDQCQLSLQAAKITTVGEKAEDFFMLSNREGNALDSEQQHQLKDALESALSE